MKQHLDTSLLQQHALLFLLKFLKEQNYRFTVITPLTHERIIKRKESLSSRSTTLRDIFGWNLTFAPEDLDPQLFVLLEKADLIHIENNQCFSKIRVASLEDELFIHSAFPTVENDAVFFGPDTYRFYYHLKQYLLTQSPSCQRTVELCCGTSAVAISIAKRFPSISEVFTADINPKALFYSQVNQQFNGLENIYPTHSNLFSDLEGNFDLIFANPPYLMDIQERQYRHGGNNLDGTELSFNILREAVKRLAPNGSIFLYTGISISQYGNKFLEAIQSWIINYPTLKCTYEEIDPDVFGEELEQPNYQHIERIAVVLVKINAI